MKATLDSRAIRIAYAADTSGPENLLSCVRIGDGKITASDGFLVAERPIEIEEESDEVLVKAADILKASRKFSRKKLVISTDEKEEEVSIGSPAGRATIRSKLLRGCSYPDTALLPKGDRKAYIAVNPGLLSKLIRAVGDAPSIKFRIGEATEPIEFVAGETRGLMMPMYVAEEDKNWK